MGLAEEKLEAFGDPANPWSVTQDDLIRQTTASLRSYVYQLHLSAAGGLCALYLERLV